jgi:tetratricopeptide (TPR) repeat protein
MSGRRDSQDRGPRGRTEPTLGKLDLDAPQRPVQPDDGLPRITIDASERRAYAPPPRREPSGRRGWLLPLILLLVIGGGTTLWLQQDRLRNLVPSTELNDVLGRANTALAAGKLDGTDGESARELFEAARALQPDSDQARDGLRRVGQAEVARADAALHAGQYDQADEALNAARELLGGGSDVERLGQELAAARNPQAQTESLVDQAQQAFAAGKLDGDDGAGALYKRVLDADKTNAVAARGLDKVGDALAAKAKQAIASGDKAAASTIIDHIAALVPGYGDLPTLRASLAETKKQDDESINQLIRQGGDDMRAGRFTGTGDDNALARFVAVLAVDPDNAEAKAGMGQIAQALIVQANAAIDGGDLKQAANLLGQATSLAPKSAELAAAKAHLLGTARTGANTGTQADDAAAEAQPAITPAQAADVARKVRDAQAAANRGDIMTPPGESAYDLYRGALAIDGNNEAARSGLQNLPSLVERQFGQALANGNLTRADDLLATLSDLAPGDAGQAGLRHRLASAWVDQAVERVNAGDRVAAGDALNHARRLDPNDPRLQDVSARLSAGR